MAFEGQEISSKQGTGLAQVFSPITPLVQRRGLGDIIAYQTKLKQEDEDQKFTNKLHDEIRTKAKIWYDKHSQLYSGKLSDFDEKVNDLRSQYGSFKNMPYAVKSKVYQEQQDLIQWANSSENLRLHAAEIGKQLMQASAQPQKYANLDQQKKDYSSWMDGLVNLDPTKAPLFNLNLEEKTTVNYNKDVIDEMAKGLGYAEIGSPTATGHKMVKIVTDKQIDDKILSSTQSDKNTKYIINEQKNQLMQVNPDLYPDQALALVYKQMHNDLRAKFPTSVDRRDNENLMGFGYPKDEQGNYIAQPAQVSFQRESGNRPVTVDKNGNTVSTGEFPVYTETIPMQNAVNVPQTGKMTIRGNILNAINLDSGNSIPIDIKIGKLKDIDTKNVPMNVVSVGTVPFANLKGDEKIRTKNKGIISNGDMLSPEMIQEAGDQLKNKVINKRMAYVVANVQSTDDKTIKREVGLLVPESDIHGSLTTQLRQNKLADYADAVDKFYEQHTSQETTQTTTSKKSSEWNFKKKKK